jgi:hypothetical protein
MPLTKLCNNRQIILGLLLLALPAGSQGSEDAAVEPSEGVVVMEGIGPGVGRAAFIEASDNARFGAIIQVIEDLTGSRDLSLYKPILDRADAYILDTRVLEREEADGAASVTLEVHPDLDRLRADAAQVILASLQKRPTVLIAAVDAGNLSASRLLKDGPVVAKFIEELEQAPFELIQPLTEAYSNAQTAALVEEGGTAWTAMAQDHMADIAFAVQFSVDTAETAPDSGLFSSLARVKTAVVRSKQQGFCSTYVAAGEATAPDAALAAETALADAAARAAREALLHAALAAAGAKQEQHVVVQVEGANVQQRMPSILDALRNVWGVEEVESAIAGDRSCRVRVRYDGPMMHLVDALGEHRFEGYTLSFPQVTGREMVVALVEDGAGKTG